MNAYNHRFFLLCACLLPYVIYFFNACTYTTHLQHLDKCLL